MSDLVNYHVDQANQQVIAEKDGVAVGVMPWSVDGLNVTFGRVDRPVCVSPDERRKGIGTAMTNLARAQFPREDGYQVGSTPAISQIMRDVLFKETMSDNTQAWFDDIGDDTSNRFTSTGEVRQVLAEVQNDLDELLNNGD